MIRIELFRIGVGVVAIAGGVIFANSYPYHGLAAIALGGFHIWKSIQQHDLTGV